MYIQVNMNIGSELQNILFFPFLAPRTSFESHWFTVETLQDGMPCNKSLTLLRMIGLSH